MAGSEAWAAALAAVAALAASGAVAQTPGMAKGADVYDDRCSGCHVIGGVGQGPNLQGVINRKAGTLAGFEYTAALKKSGLSWTPANLDRWLMNPQKLVPGTAMTVEVPDAAERRELIAYLSALR